MQLKDALEVCSLARMDLLFEPGEGMAEVIKAVKEDNGVFRGTKLKYVNDSEILGGRTTVIGM